MQQSEDRAQLTKRVAPIDMSAEEFRAAGHRLVDRIADFLDSIPKRPVTPAEHPQRSARFSARAPCRNAALPPVASSKRPRTCGGSSWARDTEEPQE